MIPVFLTGDSELQAGPFRIGLRDGRVRAVPWPSWMTDWKIPAWKPLAFSRYMDGGIWIIRCDWSWPGGVNRPKRTGLLAVLLDRSGGLVGTIPRNGWRLRSRDLEWRWDAEITCVSVYGGWALADRAVIRDGELAGWLELEDRVLMRNHQPCLLRMGPGGLMLTPSGAVIDSSGKTRMMMDLYGVFGTALRHLGERGVHFFRPVLSVLGWDEETVWLMISESGAELSPVAVIRAYRLGDRLVDPSVEAVSPAQVTGRVDRVPGPLPLPDGGWVFGLRVPSEDGEMENDVHRLWFRLPGSDEVSIVAPENLGVNIPWHNLSELCFYVPGVGLVALASYRKQGGGFRPLVVLSDGKTVSTIEAGGTYSFGWFLEHGWEVLQESNAVFHPGYREKGDSPPEGLVFLSDLQREILAGVEDSWRFGIDAVHVGDSMIALVFGQRGLVNRFVVGVTRIRNGKIRVIWRREFPGRVRSSRFIRRSPYDVSFTVEAVEDQTRTVWWIGASRDGRVDIAIVV